jgi:hypothetical protein
MIVLAVPDGKRARAFLPPDVPKYGQQYGSKNSTGG